MKEEKNAKESFISLLLNEMHIFLSSYSKL